MLATVALGVAVFSTYLVIYNYLSLRRNIKIAKESGIHYVVAPILWVNRFWLITFRLWLPILRRLPEKWTRWVDVCMPDFTYDYGYAGFQKIGHDTFLIVSPQRMAMHTCEPEVISQITMKRTEFPKPIAMYAGVDVFGKNVVSTEGATWKHHRKVISPPFTEKNNHLVWTETINQASAMLQSWLGPDGEGNFTVDKIQDDTMRLALHVISCAGFGKQINWPTSDSKVSSEKYDDGSKIGNTMADAEPGHTMSYVFAIHCLLDNILLQFLFPRWMLTYSPFKKMRQAQEAYDEWKTYMEEAVQAKKQEVSSGMGATEGQMDIMRQLIKGQMEGGANKSVPVLSDQEILGNMFVLILAGHETAANSIHFSILNLALHPHTQRRLQRDLDDVFQGKPPSEWDYGRDLPRLFGGMAGAILAEELRIIPPVINIPKSTVGVGPQPLTVEGKQCMVPANTYISLCTAAAHCHPKYWPAGKPTLPGGQTAHPISNLDDDLREFRPERWFQAEQHVPGLANQAKGNKQYMPTEAVTSDGLGVSESADTSEHMFKPVKGSYLPFSEGYRACLGRRFAQVEVLAALAVIFQKYSVELAVDDYASDEELIKMDTDARAEVWQKAASRTRRLLNFGMGVRITLQMREGTVTVRVVPRGKEKFHDDVDEIWKKNHPDQVSKTGTPGWSKWTPTFVNS